MQLSVETKVAAAVATAFVTLTAVAIGQGGGAESGHPNNYDRTGNPDVKTQMSDSLGKVGGPQGANKSWPL